ncbi:MAG: protein-L-isoaspartate O-methyltransferase [Nevskiaceae bacterium]|jgi:protein-L-isoaspartate(D-aspartate) O-methyltransferase|nr:protein-L-isoaspartate O-methyltransferase [Nevskiaceae bacterium]
MLDLTAARRQMTTQQVRAWSALDDEQLAVFDRLAREDFVPEAQRALAYADLPVPLPCAQHMLQPSVVGRIVQAVKPTRSDQVLEIGTGSGYVSACLALLAGSVHSIEIHDELAEFARGNLRQAGIGNVELQTGDAFALITAAPCYDIIVITGSMPVYDARFEAALKPGGRLYVVTGDAPAMQARLITQHSSGVRKEQSLFETATDALVNARRVNSFVF